MARTQTDPIKKLLMDYWGSFPDELIIRVLLSLVDDPRPILVFAQTSKRHNAIATDDAVWLPITAYFFKWFGIPSVQVDEDVLRQNRSRILTHVQSHQTVYHQLFVRLFGPYHWLLGWWVVQDHASSSLCRVYVRFAPDMPEICSIIGHPVVTAFDTYEPPEELHHAVRYTYSLNHHDGYYLASLEDHPTGTVAVYGHNPARLEYPQYDPDRLEWFFEVTPFKVNEDVPTSKRGHRASRWNIPSECTLTPPVDTSPWADVHPGSLSERLFDTLTSYNDAPFPSPSSVSVVAGIRFDASTKLPIVPRAAWDWPETEDSHLIQFFSTPIHSPSYYPPETDELLATGIYMTPGSTARRFVFLQIRELTDKDFVESWPWEGHFGSSSRGEEQLDGLESSVDWTDPDVHLGPFSAVRCTAMETRFSRLTSEEHVRPGARIIEITKLVGQGAPRGQRTVVAFLQDPLVLPDRLAEVQAQLPVSYRDLSEEGAPPWPISRKAMADSRAPATTSSIFQIPFEPERGIDIPAVGRVAHEGFIKPSWLDVIVHVESRDRFTVFWQDIDHVELYTKMNDI